ncbi:MAG: hypothetical protein M9913_17000 [Bryobacteraceae bacterium]|nr:hypothetical protein [Solibacteraceae bacterium]MCO5352565.1 hypothetical protein [Bryobacteraceae bacterium]
METWSIHTTGNSDVPKTYGVSGVKDDRLSPMVAVCIRFKDLFDAEPDLAKAQELLRPYDRSAVLATLSKLNALLKTWRRLPDFQMGRKVAKDFFPNSERRAQLVAQKFPNPVFFTRLGILATMRMALQECPASDGKPIEREDVRFILACCIMMNDLTNTMLPRAEPSAANILTSAIHLHDSTVRGNFEADLVRSISMFEQNAGAVQARGAIDFGSLFSTAVGLDPRTFAEICISIGARYLTLTEAVLGQTPEQFFIEPHYFSSTTLAAEKLAAFLSRVAVTEDELAAKIIASPNRPLSDLTPFQLNPIIRLRDERFYCVDLACLLDKAGRGMYWTLRDAAPKHLWSRLPGAYGELLDSYLAALLPEQMADRSYLPHPRFGNGDEAFDGVLVEGADLVTLEFKSSVLRADRKYSGDPAQLLSEIDKKFVTGDGTGAKGISQFTNSLERLFEGDAIEGIALQNIRRVFPVMVVLDHSLTAPQFSRYLNSCFDRRSLAKRFRKTVTPLTVVDVENFERLSPYIECYGMRPLLESYYESHVRHTRDQLIPFKPENVPFLFDRPTLPDRAHDRFREFLRSLGKRMFGVEDVEPPSFGGVGLE